MAIDDYKITESDRQTNGVVSAPDTLTGEPQENKSIFDRLVGFVADKYNLFIDYVSNELSNRYTKEETDQAINEKVVQIGAGDMTKAVYDKNSDGIVDDSEMLGGQLPGYYGTAENSIQPYTCTGNILSGTGKIGRFKADRSVEYSSFTVSGKSYNARQNGETSIELVSGAWYTFILDDTDNTINFNGGGGLSNSKLALATAETSDVKAGKTFYAGNKELKTGTGVPTATLADSYVINNETPRSKTFTVNKSGSAIIFATMAFGTTSYNAAISVTSNKTTTKLFDNVKDNSSVVRVRNVGYLIKNVSAGDTITVKNTEATGVGYPVMHAYMVIVE